MLVVVVADFILELEDTGSLVITVLWFLSQIRVLNGR